MQQARKEQTYAYNDMRFGEIAALNDVAQLWVIFPGQELLLPLQ